MESSLRDIIKMVKDMEMEFYRQNISNLKENSNMTCPYYLLEVWHILMRVENSLQNNLKEF